MNLQGVGGLDSDRWDRYGVHLDGSGGLTKEKIFNKITDILLIFYLVVVIGVDFSEMNPAFFFQQKQKKECLECFFL